MIAIVQPIVPHYRTFFFHELKTKIDFDLFTFSALDKNNNRQRLFDNNDNKLFSFFISKFIFFSPFPLLSNKYSTIVLSAELSFVTNWFILIFKKLIRKKIILWGQGVNYTNKRPISFIRKIFYYFADGCVYYTEKEKIIWDKLYPKQKHYFINNSLFVNNKCIYDKSELREKYSIHQEIIFISSFRFTNRFRRLDVLENNIKSSNKRKYAFIIIGDGPLKPNFKIYENVFDFGELYDIKTKCELFNLADYYFQPGWTGLSIVEAMAFGKPIVTYQKSETVRQCVEYNYLINNYNSIIIENPEDSIFETIEEIDSNTLKIMTENTRRYYEENFTIEHMVQRMEMALNVFN